MIRPGRVGIDLTTSARSRTGLETYALSLTEAVLRLESDMEFVVFTTPPVPQSLQAGNGRVHIVESPFGKQILRNQIWLVRAVWKHGVELMHYPAFPPLFPPGRFVLTIHDVTPWRFPRSMSRKGFLYFRTMLGTWAPRSHTILTVSSSARDEIVRILKIPAERVSVVRPAIRSSLTVHPITRDREILRKFKLLPGYILFVGIIEPRKNLPVLIEAVARFKDLDDGQPLVIAGRPGWGLEQVLNAIGQHRLEDRVVFTGYVSDEELTALYRGAKFLIQPSVYEGFGLPVLEAMALGCPVIASSIPAHKEILGDAGQYFSPLNIDELVQKMRLFSSPDQRFQYSERGKARATLFTWQVAAEQAVAIYRAALRASA